MLQSKDHLLKPPPLPPPKKIAKCQKDIVKLYFKFTVGV